MLLLPLLFCCALQRSCGAAGDTNPRGRPEDRTWLLACGPCWHCLMALGPCWHCQQGLGAVPCIPLNGLASQPSRATGRRAFVLKSLLLLPGCPWVLLACKCGSSMHTRTNFHQISPAFTMQALLECLVALLARLRAQPALLEGLVALLALLA